MCDVLECFRFLGTVTLRWKSSDGVDGRINASLREYMIVPLLMELRTRRPDVQVQVQIPQISHDLSKVPEMHGSIVYVALEHYLRELETAIEPQQARGFLRKIRDGSSPWRI